MKLPVFVFVLILTAGLIQAQDIDTFLLHYPRSINDTILYQRIIRYDKEHRIYHVRDYYPGGKIQMEADYSSFDKTIKETRMCNYHRSTKEGSFKTWYENGQREFSGTFKNGLTNGRTQSWYPNGQIEADEGWLNGQMHGKVKYWNERGELEQDLNYDHGINLQPKKVSYPYLPYLPKGYETDTTRRWPLIIYLHGGSTRGTLLKRLYDAGIPDQIYRGRDFPFLIMSPLCPLHLRWSTDNWFDGFFKEISEKYRIDTTRIYLTGLSLGGEGTWYLAAKYPEIFAAIAPISGFTRESDFIVDHINNLVDLPIWAFHGKLDNVVQFEDTERIIKMLEGKNKNLRFTAEPGIGHGLSWQVYPGQDLFDWFLKFQKSPAK